MSEELHFTVERDVCQRKNGFVFPFLTWGNPLIPSSHFLSVSLLLRQGICSSKEGGFFLISKI